MDSPSNSSTSPRERQRLRRHKEYRKWETEEFDIPKRHSKSVFQLADISDQYRWLWSLTVKGFEIVSPEECDKTQKRLIQLLREVNKRWGLRFLLKREFDLERGRHWPHWHIYSPDHRSKEVEKYLLKAVLKIAGEKNNLRRVYRFRENPTQKDQASCAVYLRKVDKVHHGGGHRPINTFYSPKGWAEKLKCRPYSRIGLLGGRLVCSEGSKSREGVTPTRVGRDSSDRLPPKIESTESQQSPVQQRTSGGSSKRQLARNTGKSIPIRQGDFPRFAQVNPAFRASNGTSQFPRSAHTKNKIGLVIDSAIQQNCNWFKHHGNSEGAIREASQLCDVIVILRKGRSVYCALLPASSSRLPTNFLSCMSVDTEAAIILG
jgi:hypothetical protein